MKNTFGNALTLTIFGESHGEEIGAVLGGVAPGIKIDYDMIDRELKKRRPSGQISTARVEEDAYRIISGVFNGFTTGAPLTVIIPNTKTNSKDYGKLKSLMRPSHADYTANSKYHGFQDYRGGGHFSGRITAPLVAIGAILTSALQKKGIYIGTHIDTLHGIRDRKIESLADVQALAEKDFPVLSDDASEKMTAEIINAKKMGDSVGGILESAVYGVPVGVGEPFFDSVESVISHLLFSVPAVKGVEFGLGFGFADRYGSEANDPFVIEDGTIRTKGNNSGGINGGITNGMPITFRSAVKPTPSIYKEQDTVNVFEMTEQKLIIEGRHDPAIIHRVRSVIDAVTAFAVADMLTVRFGTDYLR